MKVSIVWSPSRPRSHLWPRGAVVAHWQCACMLGIVAHEMRMMRVRGGFGGKEGRRGGEEQFQALAGPAQGAPSLPFPQLNPGSSVASPSLFVFLFRVAP